MDEVGAPPGKAVVVGFAAYVVGSAFKLEALKVRRDRRDTLERQLSIGGGSVFSKFEEDSCRYRFIAVGD